MKNLKAKIGEYTKGGKTVGKYADVGVILSNENGEYAILNPTVCLAGVLLKQQFAAVANGTKVMDSVLCSIFDNSNKPQAKPQNNQGQQPGNPDAPAF